MPRSPINGRGLAVCGSCSTSTTLVVDTISDATGVAVEVLAAAGGVGNIRVTGTVFMAVLSVTSSGMDGTGLELTWANCVAFCLG
jgi:hypothetical protein